MNSGDPFASQNQLHTRVARFYFQREGLFKWYPAEGIDVSYMDTFDKEWHETRTSKTGKISVVITYPLEKWRSGVVLTLSVSSVKYSFKMSEIDHSNDDYLTINL